MDVIDYRNRYNQLLGQKNDRERRLNETVAKFKESDIKYNNALVAQSLIQKAARNTQEKLKFSVEKIVTSAIDSVFDDGYTFELEFVTKNNKTNCIPKFVQDEEDYDVEADLGGSIGDIASFACRISLWTLAGKDRTTPIFLLDESLKHLSAGYRELGSALLKEFCDELGMQIIISTHLTDLIESASNTILVEKERGVSRAYVENQL